MTIAAESEAPAGYSYFSTGVYFALGGLVTSAFSGSLAMLTTKVSPMWVLLVGMVVPCFTWVAQGTASYLLLDSRLRQIYWGDLGRICLLGSFALLPAAILNFTVAGAQLWWSAANVPASVAIMAGDLFRRCRHHGLAAGWPISWVVTITVNMTLFYLSSRSWW